MPGRFACPTYNANNVASHENDTISAFNTHRENSRTDIVTYVDATDMCSTPARSAA
jgi:hypothetical protein